LADAVDFPEGEAPFECGDELADLGVEGFAPLL
jgi:hypothetical protein